MSYSALKVPDMKSTYQWLPDRFRPEGMMARSVLQDVEQCLEWFDDETDEFRFRMALIAAVALVRTVGHVLKKVDGQQDPALMAIVDQRFSEWKRDRPSAKVFWEFIDAERNSILKEYDLRFDFSPMVTTAEADHAWRLGSNIYCPISEGAYAGEDVRDVLREAVCWWKSELVEIERRLSG
jgi:hypothetical protein